MTFLFSPGVCLPGDGDRAAKHHPVSGQCPPPPAAPFGAASPAPHPGRAAAAGHGDAQQWQAVRGRGARPAGAETSPRGRLGSPRLHPHTGLPRVPQVPGPAGAAVACPQRGESGMGQDHQQQRARVAPVGQDAQRPGAEAEGPGGTFVCPDPRLVGLRHFSPDLGFSNFTKGSKSPNPSQRQHPYPGTRSTQRHCTQVGKGRSPSQPKTTRTQFLPWAFPSRQNDRIWGGGACSDTSIELVESAVEFPLRKGPLYSGCSSYRKIMIIIINSTGKFFFSGYPCFLLIFFSFLSPSLSSSSLLFFFVVFSILLFCLFAGGD